MKQRKATRECGGREGCRVLESSLAMKKATRNAGEKAAGYDVLEKTGERPAGTRHRHAVWQDSGIIIIIINRRGRGKDSRRGWRCCRGQKPI
ncbi:hypothetical protein JTE90_022104 [Oedothorax gibbosus]|uniref:Uncharacterized protein n=1 Tax=Oedothorax gibbosus TaxID=931172 RepID=A0AAV6U1F6_9ARAC|nr:hypothetical protein JTE90_022104 [Oedothorax gibbosus]